MKIVLYQPDIPQNTGNIVRTCALTGSSLALVRPLGFSITARHLKRAGLDYWDQVNISCIDSIEEVISSQRPFFFFSSKASKSYTSIPFTKEAILIFGSETKGLPQELWEKYPSNFYTIPMKGDGRCLNLSNAVSIVLYEGWRQLEFAFEMPL